MIIIIIYYYHLLLFRLSTPALAVGFLTGVWVTTSLFKSPGTLLRILADLNNALVEMISTLPPISKFSSFCINPLVTVPRVPIIISITVSFMFTVFFNSLARSRYLSLFLFSFNFTLWSAWIAEFIIWHVLFFLLIITWSGRLAEIRWSVCMSKSHRSLCVSFSRTDFGLCIYNLFVWSNFIFLNNSQWFYIIDRFVFITK